MKIDSKVKGYIGDKINVHCTSMITILGCLTLTVGFCIATSLLSAGNEEDLDGKLTDLAVTIRPSRSLDFGLI